MTVSFAGYRWGVTGLTAFAVLLPLAILVYQSLLTGPPVQSPAELGIGVYKTLFADAEFWNAAGITLLVAAGMTVIAVPLGTGLAFLIVRTDLPGRKWLEPLILVPIFVSTLVLAFGYVLTLGPAGVLSTALRNLTGVVPWNIHSLTALIILAGLIHVSHVHLYTAAALRGLGGGIEDSARVAGASPWQVAIHVSLPLVLPAILTAGVLVFFLGFALFGLPLVIGDPQHIPVLSTYLYKLGNKSAEQSYQLMAGIAVAMLAVTIPLVLLQRLLLHRAQDLGLVRGESTPASPLKLQAWRWPAFFAIVLWFAVTALMPLAGIALRSFTAAPAGTADLAAALTLDHYRRLFENPELVRSVINTLAMGLLGGAVAIRCYGAVALATSRRPSRWGGVLDYLTTLPRAMPGIVAGLAVLWLLLLVSWLTPLKDTLVSVWFAYTIVWLGYGMRLVSGSLLRIAPELEEAARVTGATPTRVRRDVTLPLARFGIFTGWLVVFLLFVREYSTGIYLLGPETELIGPLLVSMWGTGMVDLVSALSVINVAMIAVGLAIAVRVGVRFHG